MTSTFELDYGGGAEVLTVMAAGAVAALAEKIAAQSGGTVTHEVTDRAKALITVPAHRQAKHGALTRAASASGLEVTPHTERGQGRKT